MPGRIQVSSANRKCALSSALFRRVHGIEDPRKEFGCAATSKRLYRTRAELPASPFAPERARASGKALTLTRQPSSRQCFCQISRGRPAQSTEWSRFQPIRSHHFPVPIT